MPEPENPSDRNDCGFLSRWSERKLALRDGIAIEDEGPVTETDRQRNASAAEDTVMSPGRTAVLTDTDMPPVEDLDADSDYSGFLSRGVSESLRNQALKKLFFSGQFNVVDGLDDYAEDFTRFAALGDIITADMRHRIEEAAKRIAADGEREAGTEPKATETDDASAAEPGDSQPESTTISDAGGRETP